jgi:hypothetical protein
MRHAIFCAQSDEPAAMAEHTAERPFQFDSSRAHMSVLVDCAGVCDSTRLFGGMFHVVSWYTAKSVQERHEVISVPRSALHQVVKVGRIQPRRQFATAIPSLCHIFYTLASCNDYSCIYFVDQWLHYLVPVNETCLAAIGGRGARWGPTANCQQYAKHFITELGLQLPESVQFCNESQVPYIMDMRPVTAFTRIVPPLSCVVM